MRLTLKPIHEQLIIYTTRKFHGINYDQTAVVSLIYGIILQAMDDLHTKSIHLQKRAIEYFKSEQYIKHCNLVCIDPELMNYIIENPDKYLKNIGEVENASTL